MAEKESFEATSQKQQTGMFVSPPHAKLAAETGASSGDYYQKGQKAQKAWTVILPTAVWILIIVGGLCFLSVLSSLNKTISTLDNLIEIEQADLKEIEKHGSSNHGHSPHPSGKADSPLDLSTPIFEPISSSWLDFPPWASLEPRSSSLGPQTIFDHIFRGASSRDEPVSGGLIITSSSSSPGSKGKLDLDSMMNDLMEALASGPSPDSKEPNFDDVISQEQQPMITANIDTINIDIGDKSEKVRGKKKHHLRDESISNIPSFLTRGPLMEDLFKPDVFSSDSPFDFFGKPNPILKIVKSSSPSDLDLLLPDLTRDPAPASTKSQVEPEWLIRSNPSFSLKNDWQSNIDPILKKLVPRGPVQKPKMDTKDSMESNQHDLILRDPSMPSIKSIDDAKEPSKSILDSLFGSPLKTPPKIIVLKLPPYALQDSKQDSDATKKEEQVVTQSTMVSKNGPTINETDESSGSSEATPKEERLTDDSLTSFLSFNPIAPVDKMSTEAQSKENKAPVKVPQGAASTTTVKPKQTSAKPAAASPSSSPANSPSTPAATTKPPTTPPASSTPKSASSPATKQPSTTPAVPAIKAAGVTRKSRSLPRSYETLAFASDDDVPHPINPLGRPGSLLFAFNNSTNNLVPRLLSRLNLVRFPCNHTKPSSFRPTNFAPVENLPPPDSPLAPEIKQSPSGSPTLDQSTSLTPSNTPPESSSEGAEETSTAQTPSEAS